MTLLLNPKFEHLRNFSSHIDTHFKQGGRTIHKGRNCLKVFEIEGTALCVKHYGDAPLRKRLLPKIHRMPKGKKAFLRPFELREQGFESPEAVAYVAFRRSLVRHSMYLICLKSHFTHTLLEGQAFADEARIALGMAFAKYIARLHDAGFLPIDLNASDVLFEHSSERYSFALIDTNSIVRKRKVNLKKGLSNLLQFLPPDGDNQAFIARYAETRGYSEQALARALS